MSHYLRSKGETPATVQAGSGHARKTKHSVLALVMIMTIFSSWMNSPKQASAEYTIDSPTLFDDEYLQAPPTGTQDVRTDVTEYTVVSGDSIQGLAQTFNISPYTISVVNDLAWNAKLKEGQMLKILPVTGLLVKVQKGDTLQKIGKRYRVPSELIAYQNALDENGALQADQSLIIPNGLMPDVIKRNGKVTEGGRNYGNAWTPNANQLPPTDSAGTLVWPASCRITQKFHYGHYAIDCANKVGTPIYAAEGGTVSKVSYTGWGGGYGEHVILDHGNGMKTLYGHMSKIYVKDGQQVGRGENIGEMGNTGRSTGPHVHFEVIVDGVKQNPLGYL